MQKQSLKKTSIGTIQPESEWNGTSEVRTRLQRWPVIDYKIGTVLIHEYIAYRAVFYKSLSV